MDKMSLARLSITGLGAIAAQALAQDQAARVWGVTSRGIFIHLAADWVIFLSFEPFRGPLTLNIRPNQAVLQNLKPGQAIQVSDSNLHFDAAGVIIQTSGRAPWSVPERPPVSPIALAGRFERLKLISQPILALVDDPLIQQVFAETTSRPDPNGLHISNSFENNLGRGEGLTPAGDDRALGFLLALNRWGDLLCPRLDKVEVNRSLTQAARCKTNSLSANLIECAARGQADERLIWMLDSLLTGQPDPTACAGRLLSWGHTSGLNALLGIAQAITMLVK